jgi:hypothetical protein
MGTSAPSSDESMWLLWGEPEDSEKVPTEVGGEGGWRRSAYFFSSAVVSKRRVESKLMVSTAVVAYDSRKSEVRKERIESSSGDPM